MIEHFTEALVLNNEDIGEFDALITLYAAKLGKVVAKAKSIKKITSKLAGHLQPLNFVNCRLIEKNGSLNGKQDFQIVDALIIEEQRNKQTPEDIKKNINIARFLDEMTFELQEDQHLWQAIKKIMSYSDFNENLIYRELLKILGFDPEHAACFSCCKNKVKYLIKPEHTFLCSDCGLKIDSNDVILI